MTVSDWLKHSITLLSEAKIDSARLDALIVLSDELYQDKSWILAHPEHTLQIEQIEKLSTKITQRTHHIPLAYIRGHSEFYGRDFFVNAAVLVPRPETENAIDAVIAVAENTSTPHIVDVGTGSGCIAITLALLLKQSKVTGIDSSDDALIVAKENAKRLNANVRFEIGDLLTSLETYDGEQLFIVANLPYVPLDFPINDAARHEPKIALFSGEDGLDHYRRLFAQIHDAHLDVPAVITESLESQHQLLASIAAQYSYMPTATNGLVQTFIKK